MKLLLATSILAVASTAIHAQDPAGNTPPAPNEPREAAQLPDDPEADAIIARAIEAIGGRAQRDQITSSRSVAHLEAEEGTTRFELLMMRPDMFLVRQEIEHLGRMEIGTNGETAWRRDPPEGRATAMKVGEASEIATQLDLQALLREIDLRFKGRRGAASSEFEGVSCDVVELHDGKRVLIGYFDKSTGLPRGFELPGEVQGTPSRRIVIEEWSNDPRPLRWARKLRLEQNRRTIMAIYASVTFDDVSETTFEPPSELQGD